MKRLPTGRSDSHFFSGRTGGETRSLFLNTQMLCPPSFSTLTRRENTTYSNTSNEPLRFQKSLARTRLLRIRLSAQRGKCITKPAALQGELMMSGSFRKGQSVTDLTKTPITVLPASSRPNSCPPQLHQKYFLVFSRIRYNRYLSSCIGRTVTKTSAFGHPFWRYKNECNHGCGFCSWC